MYIYIYMYSNSFTAIRTHTWRRKLAGLQRFAHSYWRCSSTLPKHSATHCSTPARGQRCHLTRMMWYTVHMAVTDIAQWQSFILHTGCAIHTVHHGKHFAMAILSALSQWQSLILHTAILSADTVAGDVNVAPNARMAATTAAAPAGV